MLRIEKHIRQRVAAARSRGKAVQGGAIIYCPATSLILAV